MIAIKPAVAAFHVHAKSPCDRRRIIDICLNDGTVLLTFLYPYYGLLKKPLSGDLH